MTKFRRLEIPEVIEVAPVKLGDSRGYFSEVFKRAAFEAEGIRIDWVQENQSFSASPGTLRGLHFQAPPVAQDKLVRVLRGAIFDVAVDIRAGSPTWGQWVACELTESKWNQLLVPAGFAHGFLTLTSDVEVIYKVSAPYSREHEMAIRWDDPDLGIAWPEIGVPVSLSAKDESAPPFSALVSPFTIQGEHA